MTNASSLAFDVAMATSRKWETLIKRHCSLSIFKDNRSFPNPRDALPLGSKWEPNVVPQPFLTPRQLNTGVILAAGDSPQLWRRGRVTRIWGWQRRAVSCFSCQDSQNLCFFYFHQFPQVHKKEWLKICGSAIKKLWYAPSLGTIYIIIITY